jgi:hypothetical protein
VYLPVDLLRQAKVYAAEHDTTVNAVVRQVLEERVSAETRAKAAAQRFLELAERVPIHQSILARFRAKSCMSGPKTFFDTNVLLYLYSNADLEKQARSVDLYRSHAQAGRMLLSTQVIQEFIVAAVRKLRLPREQVREIAFTLFDSPLM